LRLRGGVAAWLGDQQPTWSRPNSAVITLETRSWSPSEPDHAPV